MKINRWLKLILIGFAVLLVFTILVLPPIIKNYLQSHSKEWLGRSLSLEGVGFNVFNGSLTLNELKLYEKNDSSVFISFESLYLNSAFIKCLFGNYDLTEITLSKPYIAIIQQGDTFNYTDLEKRFASGDSTSSELEDEPIKYWLRNISVNDGIVSYRNRDVQSDIQLEHINVQCPLFAWDEPQQHYDFSFSFNQGGKAKGTFDMDIASLAYKADYALDSLNIEMLLPYVKDYMKVGSFKGLFTSHQQITGNFSAPEAIATKGELRLNDFALTDSDQGDLMTAGELKAIIDTLNVAGEIYDLKYLSLTRPYLKFELFEEGNNFTRLLNEYDSEAGMSSDSLSTAIAYGNIFALMAAYVQELSETYAFSNYKADSVVLRQGKFVFNDYTLHSKFNYVLEDLLVKAESVSSANEDIVLKASSTLNTSGKMEGEISVNPNGFRDMDIRYTINELLISDFNPYANYYVAYPFTNGVCYYASTSSVKDRYLISSHKLEIKSIGVGKKEESKTAYNLPIRLVVALLRDKDGNVNLELPIEGNLDDPKYKVGKVIWQVLKNLISKAAAAPGKLLAKKSGMDEKLLEGIVWQPLQTELDDSQKKSLGAMTKTLEGTPEMKLDLIKTYNFSKELDELALQESKKRFLFFHRRISSEDDESEEGLKAVDSLHPQDSLFMAYVEEHSQTQNSLLSIFDKSKRLIGNERLQNKLNHIFERRSEAVQEYLIAVLHTEPDRIKLVQPKEPKEIAYEMPSRMETAFYVDEYN